ncbi:hypothetical protein [Jiella sp. M17.18]|uniref:hypothetical protein n=1 Tax=Jiella sp. M17.18 TaxID=3234247 RepID=UPI0034DDEEA1
MASRNVVLLPPLRYLLSMPTILLDVTAEEQRKLETVAASNGESVRDYVLKRALSEAPAPDHLSESEALRAMSDYLSPRIEQARRGEFSTKSLSEIRREARTHAER